MTAYMIYINLMVQGYYDYQSVWDNPLEDGDLLCEWETGNSQDLQALAIKKIIDNTLQVVGCVPRIQFVQYS